jgi:molybdopterin-guanine dinucleotide biosynthesis protein A
MPTPPSVRSSAAAAILAGGRGTRLGGADKGALVIGGRTILDRQLDVLSALVDRIVVVGGDHPPASARGVHVPHVADRHPGLGPLAGLQAALHHFSGPTAAGASTERPPVEVLLIVACDLPFLSPAFLALLLDRALAGAAEVDAVVPRTEDRLHPLCAAYNRRVRRAVDVRVASRALAVRALFDDLRVAILGPEVIATFDPEGVMLWNVNTPEEYERACARAAMA